MSVSAVLDANILLYAASKDPADATRAARALELMETEDLNHGQDYDGVKVVNPFL